MMNASEAWRPELSQERKMSVQQWTLFARLFLGAWWIVEATIGKFWKWGWFGSGTNPDWLGTTAGAEITATAVRAKQEGVWAWYGFVLDSVAIPNAEFLAWVTSVSQVVIGVAIMFGLFTRAAALSGLVMLSSILLMGSFRTSPLLIALTLFVLLIGGERVRSVDRWIADRGVGTARSFVTLGVERVTVRWWTGIAIGAAALATYFLLQQATRPAPRFIYVGQEVAVILFAVVAAIVLVQHHRFDRLAVATGLLRMYVGYKLLWWVWTAPQASLTSLPGFVDRTAMGEVWRESAASHLPGMDQLVLNVFASASDFWVIVFGLIQVGIGVLLLVGWNARLANGAAIALTGGYVLLGFTRYAPYLLGFSVIIAAFGAAPRIGVLALVRGAEAERAADSPRSFALTGPVATGLALIGFILIFAAIGIGIEPNGYATDVGSTVLWTLGLDAALLATAARVGLQSAGSEPTVDLTADQSSNGRVDEVQQSVM